MGDEVRRTQFGDNNAYCQDNETSWFDWTLLERHADVHRFVRLLNARRALRDARHGEERTSLVEMIHAASKSWRGVRRNRPDWGEESRAIGFSAELRRERILVYLLLNAYWEALEFELPIAAGYGPWRRWIDTALDAPHDIAEWDRAPPHGAAAYRAAPRSMAALFALSQ